MGGIGSGKTLAGVFEMVRQPRQTFGAVLAPTYPMLRDATQRTFFELFRGLVKEHNKQENVTLMTDGKVIFWRSADQPDRLRGPNLNWFYLDEADYMPAEIWDVMLGRIRRPPSRCWITTTPDGLSGKGWVKDRITKKANAGNPDYARIGARTRDNIFLPVEYVRTLEESYTSQYARQELDGEDIDAMGRVMKREWLSHYAACPEGTKYVVGVDLAIGMKGTADDRAIVVVGKHGTTYFVADVIFGKWSFNETKDRIARTARDWNAVKVCVENVAYQEAMVQQLRAETMINVKGVNPQGRNKLTRFLPIAGKYEYGYIRHAHNLPNEFTEQLLTFDGEGKSHDDMIDALIYAVNGHDAGTFVYDI